MLRRCAVIGDPAAHSLSPAIHRAGYEAHGLDWSYDALTVHADALDETVRRFAADPSWVGLSVTAPHKQAILAHGEPDGVARLVGGANTLVFGDHPTCTNTDVSGFVRAWRAHGLASPRVAGIVGNGATARSLLVALAGLDVREVVALARRPERAADLVALGSELGITVGAALLNEGIDGLDLLASTIPAAATTDHAARWVAASRVVFDVVYDPWPTPLGEAAAAAGRAALNGLDLLAGQAVDQFKAFTGLDVTFEQCRRAAGRELGRCGSLTQ